MIHYRNCSKDRGLSITVLSTGGSGFGENQLGLESIACPAGMDFRLRFGCLGKVPKSTVLRRLELDPKL